MNKTCSLFGYTRILISDNGPQFVSAQFEQYCRTYNIVHRTISPYFPSANGEVENMNRTLKKVVQHASIEGKDIHKAVEDFLLVYRSTPHSVTQVPPADLLFKHQMKTDIPHMVQNKSETNVDKKAESADTNQKLKVKEYVDKKRHVKEIKFSIGESVLTKSPIKHNKLTPLFENNIYTIVKCYPRSVLLADSNGKYCIRNKSHIKKYLSHNPIPANSSPMFKSYDVSDPHVPFCFIQPDTLPELDHSFSDTETESDWVTDTEMSSVETESDSDNATLSPVIPIVVNTPRRSTRLQLAASRRQKND